MITKLAERTIVCQIGEYSIRRAPKGFEVYRDGPTAALRCAVIGFEGDDGLKRAKAEIARRMTISVNGPA